VPSDLSSGESNFSINEILSKYEEFQQIRHTDKRDNIAATIACKSAVKTGFNVSIDQIKAIIIDLFKCQIPYVCPHGRPVILDISLKSLDLKFKRT
jgi:DNA mismatch repair protein MutL